MSEDQQRPTEHAYYLFADVTVTAAENQSSVFYKVNGDAVARALGVGDPFGDRSIRASRTGPGEVQTILGNALPQAIIG